jgi:hypothetical protein
MNVAHLRKSRTELFIPPRTRAEIQSPAAPGGRHEQAKKIALSLLGQKISSDAVFVQLRGMYEDDFSDREIENLINWALARNPQPCGNGLKGNRRFQRPEMRVNSLVTGIAPSLNCGAYHRLSRLWIGATTLRCFSKPCMRKANLLTSFGSSSWMRGKPAQQAAGQHYLETTGFADLTGRGRPVARLVAGFAPTLSFAHMEAEGAAHTWTATWRRSGFFF